MSKVIEVDDSTFDAKVLKAKVPVLVDFHSVFCGPCHRQKPVLAELADDVGDRAKVFTVEIGVNETLAEKYGISVVPTLIVFVEGRELHRMVGLKAKKYLREALGV